MNDKNRRCVSKPTNLRLWINVKKIFASEVYSVHSGFTSKSMAENYRLEGETTIEVVQEMESPKGLQS